MQEDSNERLKRLERFAADQQRQSESLSGREPRQPPRLDHFWGILTSDLLLEDAVDGKPHTCSVKPVSRNPDGSISEAGIAVMGVQSHARKTGYKIASETTVEVGLDPFSGVYMVRYCYGCYVPSGGS